MNCCCGPRGIQIHTEIGYASRLNEVSSLLIAIKLERMDVKRRVIDDNKDPHVVAGESDVSVADLFCALAY